MCDASPKEAAFNYGFFAVRCAKLVIGGTEKGKYTRVICFGNRGGEICIFGAMALLCALPAHAANLATDNASDPVYTNGWTTSSSGGTGWGGGWQLTPASNTTVQGFFIGSSTSNGGGDPG